MDDYQHHTTAVSYWQNEVLASGLAMHQVQTTSSPAATAARHAKALEAYAKAVANAEAMGYSVDNTAYMMFNTPVLATS